VGVAAANLAGSSRLIPVGALIQDVLSRWTSLGVPTINGYVLLADEPVLVDGGIHVEADAFVDALSSSVNPSELRWVWLTHDDADHTGATKGLRARSGAPAHARFRPFG
jgi:glyoxylase-like metal-dependent hydrolase (beta-lactamase superfamily II)